MNWHTIYWSVGLQFILALLVLKWKPGNTAILWIQARFDEFFAHTAQASQLLFGDTYRDHEMIFKVSCFLGCL